MTANWINLFGVDGTLTDEAGMGSGWMSRSVVAVTGGGAGGVVSGWFPDD